MFNEVKLSFLWETINSLPGFNVVSAVEDKSGWTITFDVADEEDGLIAVTMLAADLVYENSLDVQISSPCSKLRFNLTSSNDPADVANWINRARDYI